ncbi:LPS export ABC transporter permease LptG [Aquabacterium sp. OR-4]|uniref:LPS export ABC transporter permease LptG n=1 Tax=Aquabacterium sp. OR-4 TaxID=2978127 RepID=UPI0028C8E2DB|nr:LPS export ABC transporter permease LptG [Aquabacterium sp. OR-4]MDT7834752.1 LPS export ABC transporter permease LptG [Aquabacterium sp. OR-4]
MKTVRRLLYRDIGWSVVFVAVAFLSLFFFIDFVDEIEDVGRNGYSLGVAALRTLLQVPGHFYELFPIAVLIGTIYAMARLAQSSEFTILRTAGLGPVRALRLLAVPGVAFALLTFGVGDYLAPHTERQAVALKAGARAVSLGRTGAWLKERRATPEGERAVSVNVQAVAGLGELRGVRIFEFDDQGRLRSRTEAAEATVHQGLWQLRQAERTDWPTPEAAGRGSTVQSRRHAALDWPSGLQATVVTAALLPVQTMSTLDLWRYTRHLADQSQDAQRHEIQFWKKALYPLACVVMVALALPFAYLHARAGGVSFKVFGGIMLGISFVLLNNAAGHLGMLRHWTPWLVAATPSLLYLLLSMAAFAWLVRYR